MKGQCSIKFSIEEKSLNAEKKFFFHEFDDEAFMIVLTLMFGELFAV